MQENMKCEKGYMELELLMKTGAKARGMDEINTALHLFKAARELAKAQRVVIVTGFVIKNAMVGETDGPPGAVALATVLEKCGVDVTIVTDAFSETLIRVGSNLAHDSTKLKLLAPGEGICECRTLLESLKPTHVIAIERPGRAKDGQFYNMRGEELTELIPDTDPLLSLSSEYGFATIAIGDGGNELGLGTYYSDILRAVPLGWKTGAVVESDYTIVAGVSNMGAYALIGALSLTLGENLLHTSDDEMEILKKMVAVGAVDGVSGLNQTTVDGILIEDYLEILNGLKQVVGNHL